MKPIEIVGRGRLIGSLLWITLGLGIHLAAYAGPASDKAIKLDVALAKHTVRVGQQFPIVIELLDSNNQLAPCTKSTSVTVEVNSRSGKTVQQSVTIAAGSSSQTLELSLDTPGFASIRATQPQLREGGAFVRVRPLKRRAGIINRAAASDVAIAPVAGAPVPTSQQVVVTKAAPRSATLMAEPHGMVRTQAPAAPPPISASSSGPGGSGGAGASAGSAPSSPAQLTPPGTPGAPSLELLASPQRTILADGKDSADIQVFLDNPAPQDQSIRLFASNGELSINPIVIAKGGDFGETHLTSSFEGPVNVSYLGGANVAPGSVVPLSIKFGAPVVDFAVASSPSSISLLDNGQIVVQLLNENNQPVSPDTAVPVSLKIDSGDGQITPVDLNIQPGSFEGRAVFTPQWRGTVTVTASTPNLRQRGAAINVIVPVLLFILSALGGLAGGWLAYINGQAKKMGKLRIVVGFLSGFVFYWGCLFLFHPVVTTTILLNPISAFIVSVLGGFLGTKALDKVTDALVPSTASSSGS